jgi:GT2 family glycosyltransferase
VDQTNPPPNRPARLSVVIVNYRSWGDVVRLASTLAAAPELVGGQCRLIVVDNASPEPVPADFDDPPPGVQLLRLSRNQGFAAGVNAGWRSAGSPWLLVLNPDVVPGPDLLAEVLTRLDRLEREDKNRGRVGVVGFGLRNPDGSRQPSVGAFPGLLRTVWEQVIPRHRRKYQPDWRVRPGRVDWVTGACMLVSSDLLAELGGMDRDFFLYYEEVALCRSAADRGWRVEYDPGVRVVHLRPLQNRPISPKMRVITRHSKLLYFRKHRPRWEFGALLGLVRVEARLRVALGKLRGQRGVVRAWRAVERVARLMAAGADPRGAAILELADAAEASSDEPEGHPPRRVATSSQRRRRGHVPNPVVGGLRGARPVPKRKDGSA